MSPHGVILWASSVSSLFMTPRDIFRRQALQMLSGRFTELMSCRKVWVFFICMASPQCWQSDRLSINDRHLWNVCVQQAFITESFQIYGDVDWGSFDSPRHKHHPSLLWVCQPIKPFRFVNQQYRIASKVIKNAKAHAKYKCKRLGIDRLLNYQW